MESGITITINLSGQIEGVVKHVHMRNYTVDVAELGQKSKLLTAKILHTDRLPQPCTQETNISEEIVHEWIKGNCPQWVKPFAWRKFNAEQRIQAYVDSFDQGFGVSYY